MAKARRVYAKFLLCSPHTRENGTKKCALFENRRKKKQQQQQQQQQQQTIKDE